ncbi:MAG: NBR1-Ig-like domain-containing protein [Anaerolineales bacterium]
MKKRLVVSAIALLISALACNLPGGATTPEPDGPDAAFTIAAQTVEAELTLVALAQPTTPAPPDEPTSTPEPTQTLTPLVSSTPTPIPCNMASFVSDVTIPDGTNIVTGAGFTKTWRLRNTGSCTWNTSYSLVYDRGEKMSGPDSQPLAGSVAPGQTVDISVSLTAPGTPGDYRGHWRLRDGSGVLFGLSTGSFWVDIKAVAPTATTEVVLPPAVAAVNLSPMAGESGTVYAPAAGAGVANTILAGDTSANHLARGYMSFDISALAGKTIVEASLNLSGCSVVRNPFANLSGIWVGEVQYTTPLSQTAYSIGGTGIQLLNAIPASPIDVTSRVQTRVNESRSRFQIRLHPASANSNNDNLADYMTCGAPVLSITYNP